MTPWRIPSPPSRQYRGLQGKRGHLTFCNQMYVMGGGRTPPNPSNEVDIYDPVSNTWSMGLPFTTPRRNFPTDTDGSDPHLAIRRLRS